MVLTLSKKLLLAFIGLTVVVLLATLSLARWSFERGFLDYTNALEQQRLTIIARQLSSFYQANADRKSNTIDWSQFSSRQLNYYLLDRHQPPPRFGRAGASGHPPPELRNKPSTALLSIQGDLLAGKLPNVEESQWNRVHVKLNNHIIAELVGASKRLFESPQETAFSKQQWITSVIIGLVALGLAVVVSLILIRIFLAPIQRMILRVSQMSNGDYQSRLGEGRQDEIGQLMNDLDRLAQQLQQNRSSRQRWLADISHELRTPVTVLSGEINAIQDGVRPLGMSQIDSLNQEVERLRHLIDDLYQLSLSDIGGLRYQFEPVLLNDCLRACVDKAQGQAKISGLEFTMQSANPVWVNADRQRLQQLFGNLLANALAYTDAPGKIEVSITVEPHQVTVMIEDSPPGVTQAECDLLFEPLYRQDASRNRRTAGAGLGLAICRNIIEAHQGTIRIQPSSLGGIAVSVLLPILDK